MEYRWKALGAVGFGMLVTSMDFGIVSLALPRLAAELREPPDVVVWISLAHSLMVTGSTLTAGRAGDLFGRRRIYLIGWILFLCGISAAALASSIGALFAARLVQASGISMLIATSNAIILDAFPDRERGRALGIVAAIVGAGLMSGPLVGGLILGALDWPAIFYLRIPFAALAWLAAWWILRESGGSPGGRLNLSGAIALFCALASLLVTINRGASWGWSAPETLALAILGLGSLGLFVRLSSRSASPILELALLRRRNFAVSLSSLVLVQMAQASVVFAVPFYLIDLRSMAPPLAGLVASTVPLMMLLLAPFSGLLFDRHGSRLQATLGLALVGVGLLLLRALEVSSSLAHVLGALVLVGLGVSVFGPANSSAIFASVPRQRHGTASASQATARNIGTAVGLGLYSVLLVTPEGRMAGVSQAFSVAVLFAVIAVAVSTQRASLPAPTDEPVG